MWPQVLPAPRGGCKSGGGGRGNYTDGLGDLKLKVRGGGSQGVMVRVDKTTIVVTG